MKTRRTVPLTALAALSALALTACGTEGADASGAPAAPGTASPSRSASPAPSAPAPEPELAFMGMLLDVARPCGPDLPAEPMTPPPVDGAPGRKPPRQPAGPLPVDSSPPGPAKPADPSWEGELNSLEQCAGRLHTARVTKELDRLGDAAPPRVRAALNGLGYIDGRIHGLRRTGTTTTFRLDLRSMGGLLCLKGSTGPGGTTLKAFALSPEKPLT
ncbi:hypothetical protein [Streptomyces sp. NPDC053431]|uniref:hypothetical protein n=1 Tax=Streptomyces sp. NPDC053431 TaxID=3365703 RepID=UPI0037D61D25